MAVNDAYWRILCLITINDGRWQWMTLSDCGWHLGTVNDA